MGALVICLTLSDRAKSFNNLLIDWRTLFGTDVTNTIERCTHSLTGISGIVSWECISYILTMRSIRLVSVRALLWYKCFRLKRTRYNRYRVTTIDKSEPLWKWILVLIQPMHVIMYVVFNKYILIVLSLSLLLYKRIGDDWPPYRLTNALGSALVIRTPSIRLPYYSLMEF